MKDGKLALVLGSAAALLAACGGGGSGGGGGSTGFVEGTVTMCGDTPVVGARIEILRDGQPLPALETRTNGVGRYGTPSLGTGTYELEVIPPADSGVELPSIRFPLVVGGGTNRFQPIFLPPILGSVLVEDDAADEQGPLSFQDADGNDPLPGLTFTVPAGTRIVGHPDAPTPGNEYEISIALVSPEQIPMSFLDENGEGRTNQVFFSLQPPGVHFEDAAGDPVPLPFEYPNVNGLRAGSQVDLYRFDHDAVDWVSAGTGTVSTDESLVVTDPGSGLPETGWNAAPGNPPPTTDVCGQVTLDGVPFEHAGIAVVTNNGFFDFTEADGTFLIEDVPVPGGTTELLCLAFTDLSLVFEVGAAPPVAPDFPKTVCNPDLVLAGTPLDQDPPEVVETVPADGAMDVPADQAVRLVFDELMDAGTLVLGDSVQLRIPGTGPLTPAPRLVVQDEDDPGNPGQRRTVALLAPQPELPVGETIQVRVTDGAADLNGNGAVPATIQFTTADPTGAVEVFAITPQSGRAGDLVTLSGVNLDVPFGATDAGSPLTFDGVSLTPEDVAANEITFVVPSLPVGPGEKDVVLDTETLPFVLLPRITSLSPSSAPHGTLVTVTGHNFDPAGQIDSVTFNTVPAVVEAGGTTTVFTTSVPNGASSGAVVVTVDGLSTRPFFFTVSAGPPEQIPPMILSSSPADGAMDVPVTSTIRVVLDELVTLSSRLTVTAGDPPVAIPGLQTVTGGSGGTGVIEFLPDADLPADTDVIVDLESDRIEDLAGNGVVRTTFGFRTALGPEDPCIVLEDGKGELADGNLQAALSLFESVIEDPAATADKVEEATFYATLTTFALAFDGEGSASGAGAAFAGLLEGFGFPPGGPNLFDPSAFVAPDVLPTDAPTTGDVRDYLKDSAIPAIQAAEAALATIGSGFESLLEVELQEDGVPVTRTVEIDDTDVLALRSVLQAHLVLLHFLVAYGGDLDVDALAVDPDLQPNEDFLSDPDFLALTSMADLVASRQALRDAIDLYDDALAALVAETDPVGSPGTELEFAL